MRIAGIEPPSLIAVAVVLLSMRTHGAEADMRKPAAQKNNFGERDVRFRRFEIVNCVRELQEPPLLREQLESPGTSRD